MPESNSLDYEEWFVSQVKHALEQVEAGEVIDHETVLKRWECKRTAKLAPDR